jgi:hypothetical protein
MAGRSFDAERWRAAAPGTDIRGKMAGDLVQSRRLVGMRRVEVIQLLGQPQRENREAGRWSISYFLGQPQYGYGIDDDFLQADLRPDGTVAEVHVYSS